MAPMTCSAIRSTSVVFAPVSRARNLVPSSQADKAGGPSDTAAARASSRATHRGHPAEETVYSCSPHRVEMLGRLVRDDYLTGEGNAVLALGPFPGKWAAPSRVSFVRIILIISRRFRTAC